MAMNLEAKKQLVSEVTDVASNSASVLAAEYRGLTVAEMTNLRTKAREQNIYVKVVRNTLAKRALEGTQHACLHDSLVGPLLLAFAEEELSAPARLAKDFAKEHELFKVTAMSVGGQLYGAESLNQIAKLPTRDEAISQLMGVMQAPIAKFVQTMAAPASKMVRTFAALRDQKQAAE